MGVQIDFMLLINPNPADLRKFLIAIISKFSNLGDEKPAEIAMSYEERLDFERNQEGQKTLNSWLSDEWIIPDLRDEKVNQSSYHYFSFDKHTLRKRPLMELVPKAFPNLKRSLISHIAAQFVKTELGKQAFGLQTDYLRISEEDSSKRGMIKKNGALWEATKKDNLLRRQTTAQKEEKRQFEQNQLQHQQSQQEETTQYELELNYKHEDEVDLAQEGEKKEVNLEQDIEAIKEKHRQELEELNAVLTSHKDELNNLEETIRNFDDQRIQLEESLESEKLKSTEVQKSTEGLHELLGFLQNPKKSQQELADNCKTLESEMQEMRDEWESHSSKVTIKMDNVRLKIQENKVISFLMQR